MRGTCQIPVFDLPMTTRNLSKATDNFPHPSLENLTGTEKARLLHRLLLDSSRDTAETEASAAFRKTADFLRETYFGLTEKKIRCKIRECLEDYFDGENYVALEVDNIGELTGIAVEVLLPVLQRMTKAGILLQGRRRRWNELGEHYNPIYKLRK